MVTAHGHRLLLVGLAAIVGIIGTFLPAACRGELGGGPSPLRVVASTTIVGDVVAQVGGDGIDCTVLFPPGSDPHTFQPRPEDVAVIGAADVIVINGLGLEEALAPVLESNARGTVVHASEGIPPLQLGDGQHGSQGEEPQEGEPEDERGPTAADHHHEGGDPHTWTDPNNVIVWTENIAAALSEADPAHAAAYRANAEAYAGRLRELDAWIRVRVAPIPPERRRLVSDHLVFGYFAQEYGFQQVGALIGSFSSNASPSARELAQLEERIRAARVPAIFVGMSANPTLAEQVANDTGIQVVRIYTGSLSEPGGKADTYLKYMQYNVTAIAEGLK